MSTAEHLNIRLPVAPPRVFTCTSLRKDEGEDSASEALSNNHSQPVPLGDVQDRDQFLNSNTAKQYAPRAAYQSFLKRKQRANGGKGFDEWHFRKKVIQW
jgi:hypothetical protein